MQSTSLPAPTKAEAERFSYFRDIGCICCRLRGFLTLPQTHHQNLGEHAGQKRISHSATVPLCPWHHEGEIADGSSERAMLALFGPSMKRHSKRFREEFGSDERLLAETNKRYEALRSQRVGGPSGR